jgi:hypothetical protein
MVDWLKKPLGENYVRDERLVSYLEGKSVACVGPAPTNTGTGLGKTIDSYDVVVRLGDFLRGNTISEDYGSRTDILVHSFNEHDMPSFTDDCFDDMKKCKFLICSQVSAHLSNRQKDFFNEIGTQWHSVNDEVFDGSEGLRAYLAKEYGFDSVLPNTGFNGILTMLEYGITELFVTGMTFYDMGKWKEKSYHDDWYTAGGSSRKFKSYGLNECREQHKQLPQIKHFQKICEHYKDRIRLDKYLSDNLWSV